MEEPNPLVHTEVDTALPVSQLLRLPQRPKNLLRVQNRPIGSFYTHPVRRPAFLRSAVRLFRYGIAQAGQKHKLRHVGRQHQGSGEVNYGPP